ncbi:hypothetical protein CAUPRSCDRAFT_12206 [Caulochytrium protostelioides]|uniref:Uncharacterized protein n=1 Tax=Caulochytrium protostelioides TaxID=1555241 RepID=A0A4P9WSG8_9FUNG|nr:hypothetical protein CAUPRSCDRAFT_12206 [Caulochytrium protostelioides]
MDDNGKPMDDATFLATYFDYNPDEPPFDPQASSRDDPESPIVTAPEPMTAEQVSPELLGHDSVGHRSERHRSSSMGAPYGDQALPPQRWTGKRSSGNREPAPKRHRGTEPPGHDSSREANPAVQLATPASTKKDTEESQFWRAKQEEIQRVLTRLLESGSLTYSKVVDEVFAPLRAIQDDPVDNPFDDLPVTPVLIHSVKALQAACSEFEPGTDVLSSYIAPISRYSSALLDLYDQSLSYRKAIVPKLVAVTCTIVIWLYTRVVVSEPYTNHVFTPSRPSKAAMQFGDQYRQLRAINHQRMPYLSDKFLELLVSRLYGQIAPPNEPLVSGTPQRMNHERYGLGGAEAEGGPIVPEDFLQRILDFVTPLAPYDSGAKFISGILQPENAESPLKVDELDPVLFSRLEDLIGVADQSVTWMLKFVGLPHTHLKPSVKQCLTMKSMDQPYKRLLKISQRLIGDDENCSLGPSVDEARGYGAVVEEFNTVVSQITSMHECPNKFPIENVKGPLDFPFPFHLRNLFRNELTTPSQSSQATIRPHSLEEPHAGALSTTRIGTSDPAQAGSSAARQPWSQALERQRLFGRGPG